MFCFRLPETPKKQYDSFVFCLEESSMIAATITIQDQNLAGKVLHELFLKFRTNHISAAELIAGAVMQTRHRPGETCRLPEICPLCPQGRQITQD